MVEVKVDADRCSVLYDGELGKERIILEDEADDHSNKRHLFRKEGFIEIPQAIRSDIADLLLKHVNQQFSNHFQILKKLRAQQKAYQERHKELRQIFSSDDASDALLMRALNSCAPAYKLGEVMELIYALMEEEDGEVGGQDGDANDIDCELASHETCLRSYGTDRHLFKLQLLDDPVVTAVQEVLPKVRPVLEETLGCDCVLVECSVLIVDPDSPCQKLYADTIWSPECETVAVFVALQDVSSDMGPTLMLPRTQTDPMFWQKAIKESDDMRLLTEPAYLQEVLGTPSLRSCTAKCGSAMVMDTRLLHCGGGNSSSKRRALLYLTFTRNPEAHEKLVEASLEDGVDLDADADIRRIANTLSYRRIALALQEEYGDLVTLRGLVARTLKS